MKQIEPGIYRDIDNNTYHSSVGISKSGLDLIAKCPALYKNRYIDGNRPEPTKPMIIGSATHTAVFEPELFTKEYAVAPQVNRRTKEGKAAYAAFLEESEGKTVLTAEDNEQISAIAGAVRNHPLAAAILEEGEAETSIYHLEEFSGELVKVRPDWMHQDLIVDLKTTDKAGPEDFSRSCFNFRYYVQAGLYLDMANAAFRKDLGHDRFNNFLFIVVEKSEPYQVAVYFADPEMIDMGRAEYQQNLDLYARLKRENQWPGYNNDKIVPIALPYWAANRIGNQPEIYN
ncbi:PD-(D/E)XK nuclease-like domain-containing protein [Desulforhopalus singaporensis]|uniref:Exodeoxyribonuclease VIII n=1 Tax=Desulforhopalus singaporensis TaxID=91360 RepID=A0A1H0UVZ5_9BACT|nr:PD-(D/E)XK nuclease-like domain-containing protein [Desulforhopalus singaporensis]SDP70422.1 exodeoxyribonuclease VIII [Desulforhopalus singaporensis]